MKSLRVATVIAVLALARPAAARQEYRVPPPDLARFVDAPPSPTVSVSPDRRTLAVMPGRDLPSIEDLAQPEFRLAGLRIDPRRFGPSRATYATALSLVSVQDGSERSVTGLPTDARIGSLGWSPDGTRLALQEIRAERIDLWLVDVETASARRIDGIRLSGVVSGGSFTWEPDSRAILVRAVPADLGAVPGRPEVPATPVILENSADAAPTRTYQDMLQSPYDETLLEHFATSELLRIGLDGRVERVLGPSLLLRFDPSPDGRYLLTETAHRPYSYQVPLYDFPTLVEVRDRTGAVVFTLVDRPSGETIPIGFGSVLAGPRSVAWRPDRDATLAWVEALDGGDARAKAPERDVLFDLGAPFSDGPRELARTRLRYAGVQWSDRGFALVSESWRATRTRRTIRIATDAPGEARVLFDISTEDRFGDPGSPMTMPNARGGTVLLTDPSGGRIYLAGSGASPDGIRPFVRTFDLASGATEEVFRSRDPWFESPLAWIDVSSGRMLLRRESAEAPPNYFVREADGSMRQVTAFEHPYPDMVEISREFITYRRSDGVMLSATLYLPPGYDRERDGPLPAFVWAYPREYKSADLAGQVADSPYRFTRISPSGAVPFVMRGYAVLDDASMPIVGEGDDEPNDTFVEQLVSSAEAAIAEGARRGVVDPERVGVGGHSYGAFMTANLLGHSDLFRAGIARSGAYNRTLTPFGFQSEERTYWEAPEIYHAMSPFMHADDVDEPILLIHGQADNNSGTFPIQSERFYAALKGHGATARLVLLPYESHGYAARESVLHMLWEMSEWLDHNVRDAAPRAREVDVKGPTG